MTLDNIALFSAIGAKMDYLNHRQSVIAQNVANSDTPGFQPQDLTPVDFGSVLDKVIKDGRVRLETTNAAHSRGPSSVENASSKDQKETYEVAPAGNAVIMEEQLIKSNETSMDYTLMTTLLQRQVGMIYTALGAQR